MEGRTANRVGSSDLLSLWGRAYGFDAVGNRTEMVHFDGSTTVTTTYDYNDGDQLVERTVGGAEDPEIYYYDDNGNLAAHRDHPDLNTAVYTHSRENRLEAFEPSEWRQYFDPAAEWREFVYDDFGRRILQREGEGQQVLRRYYYDGLNVVLSKEKSSATSNAWRTRTVATVKRGVIGARVHERRIDTWTGGGDPASWTDRWYHHDRLGNVIAETDNSGWEAVQVDMEAFGNVQSGGQGKYRLTGKEYDPAMQAYDFASRWYDPAAGRFLERNSPYMFAGQNPAAMTQATGGTPSVPTREEFCANDPCQKGGRIVVVSAKGNPFKGGESCKDDNCYSWASRESNNRPPDNTVPPLAGSSSLLTASPTYHQTPGGEIVHYHGKWNDEGHGAIYDANTGCAASCSTGHWTGKTHSRRSPKIVRLHHPVCHPRASPDSPWHVPWYWY